MYGYGCRGCIAEPPPKPPETHKTVLRISPEPDGALPLLDDAVFTRQLNKTIQSMKNNSTTSQEEIARFEANHRATANRVLESYTTSWKSWAAGERPRRLTISLYGDLFTLMHQMGSGADEQTARARLGPRNRVLANHLRQRANPF